MARQRMSKEDCARIIEAQCEARRVSPRRAATRPIDAANEGEVDSGSLSDPSDVDVADAITTVAATATTAAATVTTAAATATTAAATTTAATTAKPSKDAGPARAPTRNALPAHRRTTAPAAPSVKKGATNKAAGSSKRPAKPAAKRAPEQRASPPPKAAPSKAAPSKPAPMAPWIEQRAPTPRHVSSTPSVEEWPALPAPQEARVPAPPAKAPPPNPRTAAPTPPSPASRAAAGPSMPTTSLPPMLQEASQALSGVAFEQGLPLPTSSVTPQTGPVDGSSWGWRSDAPSPPSSVEAIQTAWMGLFVPYSSWTAPPEVSTFGMTGAFGMPDAAGSTGGLWHVRCLWVDSPVGFDGPVWVLAVCLR